MNTNDLETVPEIPSQPARITRRSFIKRTGATVIVTALALHAFRAEAGFNEAGKAYGSWPIKVINAPDDKSDTIGEVAIESIGDPADPTEIHHRVNVTRDVSPKPAISALRWWDGPSGTDSVTVGLLFVHEVSTDAGNSWSGYESVNTSIDISVTNPDYDAKGDVEWEVNAESYDLSSQTMRVGIQVVSYYSKLSVDTVINYIVGLGGQGTDLTGDSFIPNNTGKFDVPKNGEDPGRLNIEHSEELLTTIPEDPNEIGNLGQVSMHEVNPTIDV